jgi:hypothetical protein
MPGLNADVGARVQLHLEFDHSYHWKGSLAMNKTADQQVVALIDEFNGGLEHEAVFIRASPRGRRGMWLLAETAIGLPGRGGDLAMERQIVSL